MLEGSRPVIERSRLNNAAYRTRHISRVVFCWAPVKLLPTNHTLSHHQQLFILLQRQKSDEASSSQNADGLAALTEDNLQKVFLLGAQMI